jgi:hypothetical protein
MAMAGKGSVGDQPTASATARPQRPKGARIAKAADAAAGA